MCMCIYIYIYIGGAALLLEDLGAREVQADVHA